MNTWALVNKVSLKVENIVIWGGGDEMFKEFITVHLEPGEYVNIGDLYDPTPMVSPRFSGSNPIAPDPVGE